MFTKMAASPGSDSLTDLRLPCRSRYRATARGFIAPTVVPVACNAATGKLLSGSLATGTTEGLALCSAVAVTNSVKSGTPVLILNRHSTAPAVHARPVAKCSDQSIPQVICRLSGGIKKGSCQRVARNRRELVSRETDQMSSIGMFLRE